MIPRPLHVLSNLHHMDVATLAGVEEGRPPSTIVGSSPHVSSCTVLE